VAGIRPVAAFFGHGFPQDDQGVGFESTGFVSLVDARQR
jgi:hypothetical protein